MVETDVEPTSLMITPESLWDDNQASEPHIKDHLKAKNQGRLVAVEVCSDARVAAGVFLGRPVNEVNSIAGGGRKRHLGHVLNHEGVESAVVATHIKGDTLIPGHIPTGCGGQLAAGDPVKYASHAGAKAIEYVRNRVASNDPVDQALRAASRAARYTQKPIMAAVVDHQTGIFHPIAIYLKGGKITISGLSQYNIMHYSSDKTFKDGVLPIVSEDDMPEIFLPLLESNKNAVAQLAAQFPEFSQSQEVQNPQMVTITTSGIPLSTRLQTICGRPNTSFTVHLGYVKDNGKVTDVDRVHLPESLAQVEYPLMNAIAATGRADPFGKTDTLLVETPAMELSIQVAHELLNHDTTQKWLNQKPNHQVLVVGTELGRFTSLPQRIDR